MQNLEKVTQIYRVKNVPLNPRLRNSDPGVCNNKQYYSTNPVHKNYLP